MNLLGLFRSKIRLKVDVNNSLNVDPQKCYILQQSLRIPPSI